MNIWYQKFKEENVSSELLKANYKKMSFEDFFWYLACLTKLYKDDSFIYLRCLSQICELNFIFNTYRYMDGYGILPNSYKQYIKDFEHSMVDPQLEEMINDANKKSKTKKVKDFFIYLLLTLLVIPLTFFLVLVCGLDSQMSAIISIIALLGVQFLMNPTRKYRNLAKQQKKQEAMDVNLKNIFSYAYRYNKLIDDPKYHNFFKAKKLEDIELEAKKCRENK